LGLRHHFRQSKTLQLERDGALRSERPLGVGEVFWSGLGPVLLWDSRQGLFWPTGGSLIRADATMHRRALGAEFNASLLRLDARHYQPTFLNHVLALRLVFSGVLGDPPFQALPALGGNLLFRGWFLGRLRDRVLLAAEAEYRVPLAERWAVVAFGSVGRVAPSVGQLSFASLRGAGGAGVRFAVRKESRANFRLDLAYGEEFSVYFQFREAY
jgi:outer membrane translocation and assembly module TamA